MGGAAATGEGSGRVTFGKDGRGGACLPFVEGPAGAAAMSALPVIWGDGESENIKEEKVMIFLMRRKEEHYKKGGGWGVSVQTLE